MSEAMSSWTKALEFLKEGRARAEAQAQASEATLAEEAEANSLTSTVPLLESGTTSPKSPGARAAARPELSEARLPRPTSPASQLDTSSLPTRSLETGDAKVTTPRSPRRTDSNGRRQASTTLSTPRGTDRPTAASLRSPPRSARAPTSCQKPAELSLSLTSSSPCLARRPKEMAPSPSTPAVTLSTPSPHLRRLSGSPPASFRSPDHRSVEATPPAGLSPVLRSRAIQAAGSPPALSPAVHRRLLEFNPPPPSQSPDAQPKNSSQYAELHRRRVEQHHLPQSTPRRLSDAAAKRVADRSPPPRPEAPEGSPSISEQARSMENFRATWARVGDLQMRHESFWEDYPDAVRTLDQALLSWLGFCGLPGLDEGLRRASLERPKAAESHWIQVLLWQEAEISRLLADNARWRTHIKFQEAAGHRPADGEQLQSHCVSRLIQDLLSVPPPPGAEAGASPSPAFDSPRCHLQDASESDPFSDRGLATACRGLLQTGTLPPSARTALRQRGAKTVAKSLLQQVQQLHAQSLQRYRAACQAAAAAKLRQTIAKCHGLLQEKARQRTSLRAAAPAVEAAAASSLEPSAPRRPRGMSGRAIDAFGVEACFDDDSLYRPRRSF